MPASLEVRILGPLTLRVDGRPVQVGKGNERVLIALLALNAGRPVSVERIIDLLWPDQPPPTAREMVRIYVGRARKRLGDGSITTGSAGYALVSDGGIDAFRFEQTCQAASRMLEEGDAADAFTALDEALALWQGAALADVDSLPFVRDERARLDELRLHATEDRVEAELALGRAGKLVGPLESLLREHPYRERLRGQLMLALYRDGRQTEALRHYHDGRDLLVEQFGVEPGPDLQHLQHAILNQDPTLQAKAQPAVPAPPAPSIAVSRRGRRGVIVMTVSTLLVAAAGLAAVVVVFGHSDAPRRIGPASVGAIDPRTGADDRSLQLGGFPGVIATGRTSLWVGDGARSTLTEFATPALRHIRSLRLPSFPYKVAVGFGAVWVANGYEGTVARVDSRNGHLRVFRPEPMAYGRVQLAIGFGSVWAASQDGRLSRLDPRSGRVIALVDRIGAPEALAAGLGSVWLAEASEDTILRIDPGGHQRVRRIPIGGIAEDLAVGDGSIWATTPLAGRVWRINPQTDAVTASISVQRGSNTVAVTPNGVWVGSSDGSISEIDPLKNSVVKTIVLGGDVAGLASQANLLWVTTR